MSIWTEAKGTVMTEDELVSLPRYDRDTVLLAQAEISFKAGMRVVAKWIEDTFFKRVISEEEWQAKLKEWGL